MTYQGPNCQTWHMLNSKPLGGSRTSPPPEFDLVPLEVGLILHHFNKTLRDEHRVSKQTLYRQVAIILLGCHDSQGSLLPISDQWTR